MFWVISVYFNIRNNLPKSGTFLLGHPVYVCMYGYVCTSMSIPRIYVCMYVSMLGCIALVPHKMDNKWLEATQKIINFKFTDFCKFDH